MRSFQADPASSCNDHVCVVQHSGDASLLMDRRYYTACSHQEGSTFAQLQATPQTPVHMPANSRRALDARERHTHLHLLANLHLAVMAFDSDAFDALVTSLQALRKKPCCSTPFQCRPLLHRHGAVMGSRGTTFRRDRMMSSMCVIPASRGVSGESHKGTSKQRARILGLGFRTLLNDKVR